MIKLYKVKIKEFNNGKIKMREFKKENVIPKAKNSNENTSSGETKRREFGTIKQSSLSRTRINLMELIENNENCFVSFITLTYEKEVEDINKAYSDLRSFIRSWKRALKKQGLELYYLAVPEIQLQRALKIGKFVIHFHLITNVPLGSALIPEREPKKIKGKNFKGIKTIKYYDLRYWKKGFSIAVPIKKNEHFELSKYLVKYLYKDLSNRFYGRQKVLHSNNLKIPDTKYFLENVDIDNFKSEHQKDIKEVFRFDGKECQFTEFIYKK